MGESLSKGVQIRIDDNGAQGNNNPGPGAKCIVGSVKKKHGTQCMIFVPGGKHALRDVTAASGLGTWIPNTPPLHHDGHEKKGNQCLTLVRGGKIGKQRQFSLHIRVRQQTGQAAHLGKTQRHNGCADGTDHGHDELEQIRVEYSPQAPERAVYRRDCAGNQDRLNRGKIQKHAANFYRCEGYGCHHDHVEENAQINCPEAAKKCRGAAAIP
ncbi:MAG: hypothetical protein BWY09_00676 [Candidatus Hydrogenedentes bacterium ADurb.Bin179]|nr:MAG: hypothetical protein BWY09_00676 [Candidatus Hydrogenedentes bacterium ADurb.Bin179]